MQNLPAWNNESEYKSINAVEYEADLTRVRELMSSIQNASSKLASAHESVSSPELIKSLQQISVYFVEATILLGNLHVYVSSELATNAKNLEAQKAMGRLQMISTEFSTTIKPFELFLTQCEDTIIADYLNSPQTQPETFYWAKKRKTKDLTLSNAEEMTLTQFKQFALRSWGDLYEKIAGSLKVKMPSKGEIGAAEASGYLRHADPVLRREAWEGIQVAWKVHEESVAAVVNNLAGCRLEEYRKRSHKRPVDFLDSPLVGSCIERETLDAMMSAVQSRIEVPRRALKAMASCMGKTQIDPWDILAPSPQTTKGTGYNFEKGIALIRAAFAGIDPSMGEFVDMMVKNQWIDAQVLPNKRPGAFCTGFAKSRTPRVFQTYMGSYQDVSTLAHELGHAYHSWVMREMPYLETHYPMTLAETASLFAETVLADRMVETGDAETQFELAWALASDATAMMINIPARFDFEKSFYEARKNGTVSAEELSDLTDKAWRKWYGQEISQTERQYWMTKLHFSIAGVSFYNFPYTFGYLFSLGIYAQKEKLGAGFFAKYKEILRDTGRMTAEDLIQKHLGQDIRKPDFWLGSIAMIEKNVAHFEKLLTARANNESILDAAKNDLKTASAPAFQPTVES